MATEKETIILDLKVDQGSAISELEKTKKSIIQLKEEQAQLTKAYKAGEVTLEEYASESVRLEAILKKQSATYSNVQKSVTGVKTSMDKLLESTKNAASEINIAGVNVGGLTQKITALANPVTAAIGAVTLLGAAYARSANGAEDLEFASTRMSAAIGLLSNQFAKLVGASEEDGSGPMNRFLGFLLEANPLIATLDRIGLTNIAEDSERIALAGQKLDDLLREEIAIRATVGERIADNQEKMTLIGESQTDINEKLHRAGEIIDNLRLNESELLAVKQKQIEELEEQKKSATNVKEIETRILEIARDQANIKKDADRKVEAINRLTSNLSDTEQKRLETLNKQNEALKLQQSEIERNKRIRDLEESLEPEADPFGTKEFKTQKANLDNLDEAFEESKKKQKAIRDKDTEEFIEDLENRYAAASAATAALTTLAVTAFGENSAIAKATGITEAIVNTYTGATLALRTTPPPLSFALAALTIANGLASVAQITRAAGGGNFVTKGPALMLVGDNPGGRERVTVEPLSGRGQTKVSGNRIAMAGGGTLTTGWDDGGLTRNGAVSQMQQALMFTNAIKNLPKPIVGVREFVDVQNGLEVKQSVAEA